MTRTIVKKYNAEIHSQSAIEALLELKKEGSFKAAAVKTIDLEIFEVAYKIIGGAKKAIGQSFKPKKMPRS